MKNYIFIIICLIWFCYITNLTVSFRPFKIELPQWHIGLTWMFIAAGITILMNHNYKKGVNDTINEINNCIHESKDQTQNT